MHYKSGKTFKASIAIFFIYTLMQTAITDINTHNGKLERLLLNFYSKTIPFSYEPNKTI